MADFEEGLNASAHRIGTLMWAMDKSMAVRVMVSIAAVQTGLLIALLFGDA